MDEFVSSSATRALQTVEAWRSRRELPPVRSTPIPMSPTIQGEGVMVIVTLFLAFTLMAGEWAPPEIVFTIVNSLFHTAGIVTDSQAASGYGNTGLLTVIFLYMVAEGIYQTGVLEGVMTMLLGRSRSPFWAIVRVCIPVMFISAFLNNTPIVSLLTPILIAWARRSGVPVKKVLIPLSFAATLGGTCTLIGTSTNLVISGQQSARYDRLKRFEDSKMNMFDIAPYGVPYAVWGFIFLALTQKWLLPGNSSRYAKDIFMAFKVTKASTIISKQYSESGLRSMHGATVVAYSRGGKFCNKPPSTDLVLEDGDILYVVGEVSDAEFYIEDFNLVWINHEHEPTVDGTTDKVYRQEPLEPGKKYDHLIQVTVKPDAQIINHRVGSLNMRASFCSTVVGVKKGSIDNEKTFEPIMDMVIEPGDILLLDTDEAADTTSEIWRSTFMHMHVLSEGGDKEFIAAFTIMPGSSLVGKTLSHGGLRGIPGLHVFALDGSSEGARIDSIPLDHQLDAGDVIWVAADLHAFTFLRKFPGVQMSEQKLVDESGVNILYRELTQAVVSPRSLLLGKTVKSARFCEKFSGVVVAINRQGPFIRLPVSDTNIQEGDVLLVEAHSDFAKRHKADKAFALLMPVPQSSPPKKKKGWIALVFGFGMVMTQIIHGLMSSDKDYMTTVRDNLFRSDMLSLWPASVLTTALMLFFKCLNFKQATDSILWDVYLTVAAAFGVSVATEATGVARAIADVFISIAKGIGGSGAALTSIYIATAVLSEILTNNAAGAVMFPIAADVGERLNLSPKSVSVAIMLGASAGFINPYSYQCNLMVYSAGNYTFKEFAIIGAPFQVYLGIVAAFILFNLDQWHQVWIVSFVVAGGIILTAGLWNLLPKKLTLPLELWWEESVEKPLGPILANYVAKPFVKLVQVVVFPFMLVRDAVVAVVNPALRWKERFLSRERQLNKQTTSVRKLLDPSVRGNTSPARSSTTGMPSSIMMTNVMYNGPDVNDNTGP